MQKVGFKMKKFRRLIICLILSTILLIPSLVSANEIRNIDINGVIKENGDIDVTQVWEAYVTEGTEFYIPMQDLNHMGKENYTVSMNGREFTDNPNWDIGASFEEKAYTYGINYSSGYPELCFGVSELNTNNTYEVNFTYTNAVQAFNDMDGFNIEFLNEGIAPKPESAKVTLELDDGEITDEIADIWAFGYTGDVVFQDGKIVATAESLNLGDYMTLLVGFEKGILSPTYEGQGNFTELRDEAMAGSDYDNPDEIDSGYNDYYQEPSAIERVLSAFAPILRILIPFAIFSFFGNMIRKANDKSKPKNVKEVSIDDGYYFREPPLDNNLPSIYEFNEYIADSKFEDILTAYLLKWINDGAVIINETQTGRIFKKDTVTIEFLKEPNLIYQSEKYIYEFLRKAAQDNILNEEELASYVRRYDSQYGQLRKSVKNEGASNALSNGYLTRDERKNLYLTEDGKVELKNVGGFKNFIEDFTLINEREPIEVKLWDDLLIVAAVLGLADTIAQQFEKIYPEYNFAEASNPYMRMNNFSTYYYISRLNNFSHKAQASYNNKQAAKAQRMRFLGSGGSSSWRGGGGSSGGGRGGGIR